MAAESSTQVGEMRPLHRTAEMPPASAPVIQWREKVRRPWSEELMKNLGVAAALVLCAVAVRAGSLGDASWSDAVLTAATGDTLLDDQLGKLTFVSRLFPEATLVFGENTGALARPVAGGQVVHAWSEAEPYLSYGGADASVSAAASGEVLGVYHGEGEELLIRVRREDGLECCYGNLLESLVQTGDQVQTGQLLGVRLPAAEATFEVRQHGRAMDPTTWISE